MFASDSRDFVHAHWPLFRAGPVAALTAAVDDRGDTAPRLQLARDLVAASSA